MRFESIVMIFAFCLFSSFLSLYLALRLWFIYICRLMLTNVLENENVKIDIYHHLILIKEKTDFLLPTKQQK